MTAEPELLGFWNLMFPALVAGVIAWIGPLLLAKRLPQTMRGLSLNALLSCGGLLALAMGYFALSYVRQGVPIGVEGMGRHFLRLGLLSAMFWAPIVATVLLQQPRNWRPEL